MVIKIYKLTKKVSVTFCFFLYRDIPQAMLDPDHGTESSDIFSAVSRPLTDNLNKISVEKVQEVPAMDAAIATEIHEVSLTLNPTEQAELEKLQTNQEQQEHPELETNLQANSDVSTNKLQDGIIQYVPESEPMLNDEEYSPQYLNMNVEAGEPLSDSPGTLDVVADETLNLVGLPETVDFISEKEKTQIFDSPQTADKIAENKPLLEEKKRNYNEGDSRQEPDNFFSKMEQELNIVIHKVLQFSSDFSKKHNMKSHVTSSVNSLSETLTDMQNKIKTLGATTAEHSIYAMEKIKKKITKMVQNIKDNSENLLKNPRDGSFSSKVIRGFNHLKDGFVKRWCSLKDKMSEKFKGQKDTNECVIKQSLHLDNNHDYNKHPYKYETQYEEDPIINGKKSKYDKNERKNRGKQYYDEKQYDKKLDKKIVKNGKYPKKYQENDKCNSNGRKLSNRCNYHKKSRDSKDEANDYQNKQGQDEKRGCLRGKRCNITDGGWLNRMSEGRASRRHTEHESEWLFDRARSRQEWRQGERDEDWYLRRSKSRQNNRGNFQDYSSSWVHTKS
jgi:hypothetical protein